MRAEKAEKLLGIVIVMQAMILLGQWTGQPKVGAARAELQLPDPGARQLQMLDELKQLNARMEKLLGVLQSGDVQVRVAKSDDAK